MSNELPEYVKTESIALLLGLTSRRVQQLTQEGIIEQVDVVIKGRTYKRYNLINTISALYQKSTSKSGPKDKEEEKLQAEIDYKHAKAKMAQLELDELESRMHSAEDVEAMTTDLVFAIRSALLSLPGQLAVDLSEATSAAEISEIIKNNVNDILDELSRYEYNPDEYRRRVRERQGWIEKNTADEDEE